MKNITLGILLLSGVALAVAPEFVPAALTQPSSTSEQANVDPTTLSSRLSIGPGLGFLNGILGFGLNASWVINAATTEVPLFIGLDTGLHTWTESASSGLARLDVSLTSIPLLATGYFLFDIPASNIHPFLGLSIGPNVTIGSAKLSFGGSSASRSATNVYFQALVRSGFEFDMAPDISFSIEPKLGLLDGEFVFLPQMNAVFSF